MTGQTLIKAVEKNQKTGQWLTLQEASRISGKSINAITLLINRKKLDRTRKLNGKGHGKWLIHEDSIKSLSCLETSEKTLSCQTDQDSLKESVAQTGQDRSIPVIPLEHYEKRLNDWLTERDSLTQGLIMYRYKYEELERQLKLLPAPVEVVNMELKQKAELSARIQELETILQTERIKPWWKKLWRKR